MGGRVYGPYTGRFFLSMKETDIEHIVAVSEAHDSGLYAAGPAVRRQFASDPLNLTLAAPQVNRCSGAGKCARDGGEWLPPMNKCWFAARIVAVKRKYALTVDRREAGALERVLSGCSSTEMIVAAGNAGSPNASPPTAPAATSNACNGGTPMGTAELPVRRPVATASPRCRVAIPPIPSCTMATATAWSASSRPYLGRATPNRPRHEPDSGSVCPPNPE